MQINDAKFLQNGKCGYVLKPNFMLRDDYNPCSINSKTENNDLANEEDSYFITTKVSKN